MNSGVGFSSLLRGVGSAVLYGAGSVAAAYVLNPYVAHHVAPWTGFITRVCYNLPGNCVTVASGFLTPGKIECLPSELKCVDSEFMIGNIVAGGILVSALAIRLLSHYFSNQNGQSVKDSISFETPAPKSIPVVPSETVIELNEELEKIIKKDESFDESESNCKIPRLGEILESPDFSFAEESLKVRLLTKLSLNGHFSLVAKLLSVHPFDGSALGSLFHRLATNFSAEVLEALKKCANYSEISSGFLRGTLRAIQEGAQSEELAALREAILEHPSYHS